jgi:hypothetical protein
MGNKQTKSRGARGKGPGNGDNWPTVDTSTFGRKGTIRKSRRSDNGASAKTSSSSSRDTNGATGVPAGSGRNRSLSVSAPSKDGGMTTSSAGVTTSTVNGGGLLGGTGRGGSVVGDSGYGSISRAGLHGSSGFVVGGSRKNATNNSSSASAAGASASPGGKTALGAGSKSMSFSNGTRSMVADTSCNTIGRCVYGFAGTANTNIKPGECGGFNNGTTHLTSAAAAGLKLSNVAGSCPKINSIGADAATSSSSAAAAGTKHGSTPAATVNLISSRRQESASCSSITHLSIKPAGSSTSVATEGGGGGGPALKLGVTRGGVGVTGSARRSMLDVSVRSGEGEQSAFVTAAGLGCADMVKMLLEIGVPPDLPDQAGLTALHAAAEHGHVAVIELLIGGGVCAISN